MISGGGSWERKDSNCLGSIVFVVCALSDTPENVQGMYRSAESKAQQVNESLADQSTEAQKLQERLGLAWQEYSSGANKLKSTNRQLQALANRVSKNDAKAQGVLRCAC